MIWFLGENDNGYYNYSLYVWIQNMNVSKEANSYIEVN
jgi:hypothetical protein